MMEPKYIGLTFDQEVNALIKTLDNTQWNYSWDKNTPNVITFVSDNEAQEAFEHIGHFLFICKLAQPIITGKDIAFIECAHQPISPSAAFKKKRNIYLNRMFLEQLNKLEMILKSEGHSYQRKRFKFYFSTVQGIAEVDECMRLFSSPSSKLGLLQYRRIGDLAIEFYRLKDVPY